MKFSHVALASLAYELPPQVLTSEEIERRLAPLYERLKLPFGRLELMTGIKARRLWEPGTRPSQASAAAARRALEASPLPREKIGALVHAAVCRDMLEPATASFVHEATGLGPDVQVFDVSNACLGFLNALVLLGGLIETGQIEAGLISVGETGRPLIERTLGELLEKPLTRQSIKPYFANLTIGSGAVAAVVCHRSLAPEAPRLIGGAALADTRNSHLCQGDASGGDGLAMQTDSEQLLVAGVELARRTWGKFKSLTGWSEATVDRFVCHQVGSVHRRRLYETLGLDLAKDFSTFEEFGNVGSASLPLTLARACEAGFVQPGQRTALLGIGSGINCLMLGLEI